MYKYWFICIKYKPSLLLLYIPRNALERLSTIMCTKKYLFSPKIIYLWWIYTIDELCLDYSHYKGHNIFPSLTLLFLKITKQNKKQGNLNRHFKKSRWPWGLQGGYWENKEWPSGQYWGNPSYTSGWYWGHFWFKRKNSFSK